MEKSIIRLSDKKIVLGTESSNLITTPDGKKEKNENWSLEAVSPNLSVKSCTHPHSSKHFTAYGISNRLKTF